MKPMELDVRKLWKQRFDRYAKESLSYWQYAARSNFLGFLLFLVIVSSYYYAKALQRLPTDYPYLWIVLLVLVPRLVISPVRTLIRKPDRMFLLRAERQMGAYFTKAYLYNLTMQGFHLFLAWVILLPLYRHCAGSSAQPFLLLFLFLLMIKAANLQASMRESRFVLGQARIWTNVLRWIWTLVVVWLLFDKNILWASAAALVAALVWSAVTRVLSTYAVNWDYIIEREHLQQARLYAFFNGFVDVPQLPARIRRRGWIAGMSRWLSFEQKNTYLYLFMKTMLRTEVFGIVQRITIIGFIAVLSMSSDAASAAIFLVAVLISTVQLSSLGQAHRYTFWLDTYPLNPNMKASAIALNIWGVLAAQAFLLGIALLIKAPVVYLIVPLLSLALSSLICGVILRRKFQEPT